MPYDEEDAAEELDATVEEVEKQWHFARTDARNDKKHRDDPNDVGYTGDWKKPR